MKIIIIGAGLGGLTAALCLSRPASISPSSSSSQQQTKNHQITLLESHPTLSPRGSGLNIRAPATRLLHSWGTAGSMRSRLEAISHHTPSVTLRNLADGKNATDTVAKDPGGQGWEDWGTNRRELVQMLFDEVFGKGEGEQKEGVEVRFGMKVVEVGEDKEGAWLRVRRRVKGGSEDDEEEEFMRADLVLAADGIRSTVREQILGDTGLGREKLEPVISDITLYGTVIPSEKIMATTAGGDDQNASLEGLMTNYDINVYMGADGFVVGRWNEKLGSYGALFGVKGETDQKGLWDEKGDLDFVRGFFFADQKHGNGDSGTKTPKLCAELRRVLELADTCDRWKLAELPNLPRWTSKGGRIALLGDSAHAMHPNAAQGYSQIVEDIGVLDHLITHFPHSIAERGRTAPSTPSVVPQIMAAWQTLRKPRAERIKDWAKWNTEMFVGQPVKAAPAPAKREKQPTEAVKGRLKSLKHTVPDMNAGYMTSAFLKWAQSWDAIGETEKYLQSIKEANAPSSKL